MQCWNSGLLYAENAAGDLSTMEIEGNVGGAFVIDEIARLIESKRVVREYTYENRSLSLYKEGKETVGHPYGSGRPLFTDHDGTVTTLNIHRYEPY